MNLNWIKQIKKKKKTSNAEIQQNNLDPSYFCLYPRRTEDYRFRARKEHASAVKMRSINCIQRRENVQHVIIPGKRQRPGLWLQQQFLGINKSPGEI